MQLILIKPRNIGISWFVFANGIGNGDKVLYFEAIKIGKGNIAYYQTFHNWYRIEKIFWWWWGWSQSIWFCDNIAEVDLAELPEMNFPRQFSNSFFRLKSSWKLKDVNLVGVWLFCLPDFWVCSNSMSKKMKENTNILSFSSCSGCSRQLQRRGSLRIYF